MHGDSSGVRGAAWLWGPGEASGGRRRGLDAAAIATTIERLCQRVEVRFPNRVSRVLSQLDAIVDRAATSASIGHRDPGLRVAVGLLVALILAGLVVTLAALRAPALPSLSASSCSDRGRGGRDLVFVAIAVFFLLTLETRLKRRRPLQAIHERGRSPT